VNIISPSSTVSAVTTHDVAGTAARRRYFPRKPPFSRLRRRPAPYGCWLNAAGADVTMRAGRQVAHHRLSDGNRRHTLVRRRGRAAIALLERYTSSAARIWTRLAAGILLLSFVPIFAEHAQRGNANRTGADTPDRGYRAYLRVASHGERLVRSFTPYRATPDQDSE